MNAFDSAKKTHFAVIFSSQRSNNGNETYESMAEKMISLAKNQQGFLGVESVRDESGYGITISYWESEEDINAWRANSEHQLAQQLGRNQWYDWFKVRVCKVECEYEFLNPKTSTI
ncbi:MAG: antibiotic biosynthesis monooxygenase family protein [Bdellovibrio sp.]